MADRDTAPTVDDRPGAPKPDPQPAPAPAPTERYRRGAEIGRGGMGRVVEAEDVRLGRIVALKETLALDREAQQRFEREVRVTARLEHPSIVPVYDAGTTPDGLPFYVMRRLAGRPLAQLIADAAGLDARLTLLPNVLAVLDAVGHAHRRGVVHRDLKPANVLVGELGETVVIDWGLAKIVGEPDPLPARTAPTDDPATGDATIAGTVIGTPGFMPPEQAIGETIDARSDVYALGASLYYVLAGAPPFHGSSASEILDRAVATTPPPLPALVPGVPPDLVTIVDKAMALDRARRYPDAVAMGEDLRRFLAGQLVASHHYSPRQRLARFVRRQRALLAVAVLGLAAIAVIGTLSLSRILRDRDRISAARADAETKRAEAEAAARHLRDLADGLIVDRARDAVATDPTLAAAMLIQLAPDSPRWPEARAVAREAAMRGIAYALPAHGGTVNALAVAPDGVHLLSFGADGTLKVHDLETRTTRVLLRALPVGEYFAWSGDRIFRRSPTGTVTLLDPVTGAVVETVTTEALRFGLADDGTIVLADASGTIRMRQRDGTLVTIDRVPGVSYLSPSPRANFLVVRVGERDRLYRRTPAGWKRTSLEGDLFGADFSEDERRMAHVADASAIVEWAVDVDPPRRLRRIPTPGIVYVMYAGNALRSQQVVERLGIRFVDHTEAEPRTLDIATTVIHGGSPPVLGGSTLAYVGGRNQEDRVGVVARFGAIRLAGSERVTRIAARDDALWLVGATPNRLLVWDLSEVRPASLKLDSTPRIVTTLGANHIGTSDLVSSVIVDTRTGEARSYPTFVGPAGTIYGTADGIMIRIRTETQVDVIEVASYDVTPIEVPLGAYLVIRDRDTVLVTDEAGAIVEYGIASGARRPLGSIGGTVNGGLKRGSWVAMRTDHRIWRSDGTRTETIDSTAPLRSVTIDERGTVHVVAGDVPRRWDVGATRLVDLAPPTVPLVDLQTVAAGRLVAFTPDNSLWRFDAKTGAMSQLLPALDTPSQLSSDGRCAVGLRDGRALVADLVNGTWWKLPGTGSEAVGVTATVDCSTIYVVTLNAHLLRWQTDVPDDAPALRAWLAARTNARAGTSHGVIEWVMPPI